MKTDILNKLFKTIKESNFSFDEINEIIEFINFMNYKKGNINSITELDISNIGSSIKFYRTKSGLTQNELAEKIDVSPSAVGMYEQGRRIPPVDILYEIALALNINFLNLIS